MNDLPIWIQEKQAHLRKSHLISGGGSSKVHRHQICLLWKDRTIFLERQATKGFRNRKTIDDYFLQKVDKQTTNNLHMLLQSSGCQKTWSCCGGEKLSIGCSSVQQHLCCQVLAKKRPSEIRDGGSTALSILFYVLHCLFCSHC